jgi:hypothetical protein
MPALSPIATLPCRVFQLVYWFRADVLVYQASRRNLRFVSVGLTLSPLHVEAAYRKVPTLPDRVNTKGLLSGFNVTQTSWLRVRRREISNAQLEVDEKP